MRPRYCAIRGCPGTFMALSTTRHVVQDVHVVDRADKVVAEQLRYYRARAGEYDATSYRAVSAERASVPAIVDRLGISGDVIELACGTGIWTVELVRYA